VTNFIAFPSALACPRVDVVRGKALTVTVFRVQGSGMNANVRAFALLSPWVQFSWRRAFALARIVIAGPRLVTNFIAFPSALACPRVDVVRGKALTVTVFRVQGSGMNANVRAFALLSPWVQFSWRRAFALARIVIAGPRLVTNFIAFPSALACPRVDVVRGKALTVTVFRVQGSGMNANVRAFALLSPWVQFSWRRAFALARIVIAGPRLVTNFIAFPSALACPRVDVVRGKALTVTVFRVQGSGMNANVRAFALLSPWVQFSWRRAFALARIVIAGPRLVTNFIAFPSALACPRVDVVRGKALTVTVFRVQGSGMNANVRAFALLSPWVQFSWRRAFALARIVIAGPRLVTNFIAFPSALACPRVDVVRGKALTVTVFRVQGSGMNANVRAFALLSPWVQFSWRRAFALARIVIAGPRLVTNFIAFPSALACPRVDVVRGKALTVTVFRVQGSGMNANVRAFALLSPWVQFSWRRAFALARIVIAGPRLVTNFIAFPSALACPRVDVVRGKALTTTFFLIPHFRESTKSYIGTLAATFIL
jgi:uncharacterized protein YhjY with autotransporter beta-barrel domain